MHPALRLAVTALVPLIAWLLARVALPGVQLPPTFDVSTLSVVALGITPAFSGFLFVEIVAALVPPLRPLRRNGPTGRRTLRRASLIVTLLIALVQGFFVARYLESVDAGWLGTRVVEQPGLAFELVATLTLVGGTAFLLSLAWIVEQFGLGNGLSVLLAGGAVVELATHASFTFRFCVGVAVIAVVTAFVLTLHRTRPPSPRQPVGGIVPTILAILLVKLVPPEQRNEWFTPAATVAAALLAIPFGWLFSRARDMAALWPGAAFAGAVAIAAGALNQDAFSTVVLTAVVIDLVVEWRARAADRTLVAAWPLPSVAAIEPALQKLRAAGIVAVPRAAAHRALYHFFAPWLQIELLVPFWRATQAQDILDEDPT